MGSEMCIRDRAYVTSSVTSVMTTLSLTNQINSVADLPGKSIGVFAGSVAEGRVTYVTRTKWIGFPDYTTAEQHDDVLRVWGRLRFGRSDFGVNKARVDRWLADLQP